MAALSLCLAAAVLIAGAHAQGAAQGPGVVPGPAGAVPPANANSCSSNYLLASGPTMFSSPTNGSNSMSFSGVMCNAGTFLTTWVITPAVSPLGASYDRVYSVQGMCSDGSNTTAVSLPTSSSCDATFTAGTPQRVHSDSSPPAYWNVYYRWDNFLDGLWGVGSFSGASSNPGVFGCPGNSYVVGFLGTAGCDGFSAFQLMCQDCSLTSNLNSAPYNQTYQGAQGNPSSPQPSLVCSTTATPGSSVLIDAVDAGASLTPFNQSISQVKGAPAPAPTAALAPTPSGYIAAPPSSGLTEQIRHLACPGETYVTSWIIGSTEVVGNNYVVASLQARCSDFSYTKTITLPSACGYSPAAFSNTTVNSDSNPPAWWNIFIKTGSGILDSYLNIGASLAVGQPQVVACPNNGYVQGIAAAVTCSGFQSLDLICSTCSSALSGLGGPNSPDGKTYKNGGFQVLSTYSEYGPYAADIQGTKNAGNNLPSSIADGTQADLLLSWPISGAGLSNGLPSGLQAGFIQGLLYVFNSTDPKEVSTYVNVTTSPPSGRKLLQSNFTGDANFNTSTTYPYSIAQLASSTAGYQGLNAYFLQNPKIFSGITLTGPATVTLDTQSSTTSSKNTTTNSATCTGSHHFGHWCHTSISRGGIIAIIVIFSLLIVALLVGIPLCLAGAARRRRANTAGRPVGAAGGATPWNDTSAAGGNANVSVANPASARK